MLEMPEEKEQSGDRKPKEYAGKPSNGIFQVINGPGRSQPVILPVRTKTNATYTHQVRRIPSVEIRRI